uniref:Uncharacterized protein n=1 Tax=Coccolithus braarudii TaxID=221442 RepID=A0A7S0Q8V2_9EUKA|mmetsp:Transcript_49715/g.106232  ORF Transcript_49715/g.106232 Transcript_49715/m.106232 type:complete len:196 (+) Transcript_49715:28-615(+)|eukprot:CAMPEP_0183351598 /NCGR_PEP_ID=MMETSP0164_2-20130417/25948_1 /TAXON_ID=221442 /ORGANISM="Coccolithus pelagicus ssp braarudi, Strain PLY182g" /LENGTH=195 /DNA_ID=CAMNT_0025523821 /DNA_START=27 /DNA_END=614 /DNA_ORIENTATION=+
MAAMLRVSSLRRLAPVAQLTRSLSMAGDMLSKFKERESTWTALAPHLPESLKFMPEEATSQREQFEDFSARQPKLVAEISKRKAANPTATGIVATCAEMRDPTSCKYTVEGTLAHTVMTNLFTYERFDTFLYEGLDFELGDAEKQEVTKQYSEWVEDSFSRVKAAMAEAGAAHVSIPVPPLELPDKIPYKTIIGL